MKILVAHCVPRARVNGMSRMMGFLHDELVRHGDTVEYYCIEDAGFKKDVHPGLHRFLFPVSVLRHAAAQAAKGAAYDIINIHEPSAAALLLGRRLLGGSKIVVTSHGVERRNWEIRTGRDAEAADRPGMKTRLIYPPTLLWQADFALRRADHVFCLNSEDAAFLVQRLRRRRESITRIFPAADPTFGVNARNRNYLRGQTLLFAGSWLVRKGTLDVIAAFSALVREQRNVTLNILNPGAPEETVLAQFPEDVRPHVICKRTGSEPETAAVFEQSDIFLLPSIFEGTPLTLIEAMWSGMPVVSTGVCGMRDVLENGRNGLLVPPRNPAALTSALMRMIDDEQLRRTLGVQAHEDAITRYQWSVVAGPVLAAYTRLLASERLAGTVPDISTGTVN